MSIRRKPRNRFWQLGVLATGLASLAVGQTTAPASNVDLPRYPAISPDGRTISFTLHGDIFTAPVTGGLATRLTTSPADDLLSAFSPDGKRLAFMSTRSGAGNLFTVALDGSGLQQVTFTDRPLILNQWSKDNAGHEQLLATGMLDATPFSTAQLWEISPAGGDPNRITPATGTAPCASPDGRRVLLTRGDSPWTRRGYRGSQNRDVWLYDRAAKTFKQLTTIDGNDGKARWADDQTVLFISDRADNTYNLFSMKADAPESSAVQLTHFKGPGVFDFDVSPATGTVVFSCWNKLYSLSLAANAAPQEIVLHVNQEDGDRQRVQSVANTVSESALSPDGKTLAIVSYGEVYVRGVDAKSSTRHVTANLNGRKRDIAWSADGQRLLFVGDESGQEQIYEASVKLTRSDLRKRVTEASTRPAGEEQTPASSAVTTQPATEPAVLPPKTPEDDVEQAARRPAPTSATPTSPGGTSAAPPSGEPSRWAEAISFTIKRAVATKQATRSPTPSPDGLTLAYVRNGDLSGNELVLRTENTGRERVLVKSPDDIDFRWSPDSRYIAYATEDRNNNADIFLIPADGSEKAVNLTRHPNADVSRASQPTGKFSRSSPTAPARVMKWRCIRSISTRISKPSPRRNWTPTSETPPLRGASESPRHGPHLQGRPRHRGRQASPARDGRPQRSRCLTSVKTSKTRTSASAG
ncbi:MAG: hypothetical protein QM754_05235 [Tepidisphaeraceae bacterium]